MKGGVYRMLTEVHTAAISGETWYKIRGILYQSFCNLVTGGG